MKNKNGTILIVTLWSLVILTMMAIALGGQASLEVKLSEYQRDKLRAKQLAIAAIERAIWEKINYENTSVEVEDGVDALNEAWAHNETVFKDRQLGDATFEGTFSLSYSLDGATLYGLEDEQSKININNVLDTDLAFLLETNGVENADALAHSILVWCGQITDLDEEGNYADLPYDCKKREYKSIPELLLVFGLTPEILYGEDVDEDGQLSEDVIFLVWGFI